MYRSLLVPLDGSLLAEHALPWALSIAEQDGVALHLVRIHIPPAPLMVGSEMSADMALDQTIRQTEIDYLEGLVKQLSAVATVPIRHALLEGAVADAIDDYAIAVKADLIVMTSHGRGAFVRFWLGSVADKIVRNSRTPVLLVRAHHE
ncbi:MAG: universal stress protein, partial [Planctomycetes bacterium]|nr:universal stress protein [Planctomycetota bacterium]